MTILLQSKNLSRNRHGRPPRPENSAAAHGSGIGSKSRSPNCGWNPVRPGNHSTSHGSGIGSKTLSRGPHRQSSAGRPRELRIVYRFDSRSGVNREHRLRRQQSLGRLPRGTQPVTGPPGTCPPRFRTVNGYRAGLQRPAAYHPFFHLPGPAVNAQASSTPCSRQRIPLPGAARIRVSRYTKKLSRNRPLVPCAAGKPQHLQGSGTGLKRCRRNPRAQAIHGRLP